MNKENLKQTAEVAGKVGSRVIIEGTKAVLFGAVAVGLGKLLRGGVPRLKNGTVDDYLRIRQKEEDAIDVEYILAEEEIEEE